MEHARCGMGAGAVGNKLIVCGGYGRGECLDSVEEFDPVAFVWKRLPDMPTQRFVFTYSPLHGGVISWLPCLCDLAFLSKFTNTDP